MSDELNPQSSQPTTDASVSPGTNSGGQPSEPVATGMTESQNRDYTIKTQQLAQERRQLEAERSQWEQERSRHSQQPQSNGFFQSPAYPSAQPAQQPMQPVVPYDSQSYAQLVEQFGKEGADAQVRFFQQSAAPVQQLIATALEKAHRAEISVLERDLRAQGKSLFGEEWDKKGEEVMRLVGTKGIPLKQAWYALNGEAIAQAERDRAYQAQQVKQQANVSQSNVQPSNTQAGDFKNFDDAFNSAWEQSTR